MVASWVTSVWYGILIASPTAMRKINENGIGGLQVAPPATDFRDYTLSSMKNMLSMIFRTIRAWKDYHGVRNVQGGSKAQMEENRIKVFLANHQGEEVKLRRIQL